MLLGLRLTTAVCVVVLLSFQAFAAQSLTGNRIKGFIASFPELQAFAENRKIDFDKGAKARNRGRGGNAPFSPFTQGLGQLRAAGAYGGATRIVRRHGFRSMESWAAIADRIMRAYVALTMQRQRPGMAAGLDQARTMIMSNPNMTPEQKARALASIGASQRSMNQMRDANPADQRAIAPYRGQLDAAFGSKSTKRGSYRMRERSGGMRSSMPQRRRAAPSPGSPGIKARLRKLKELYDSGLISKQEYDAKRAAILSQL